MRVVVLSGGRSSEHEVSLRPAKSVAEGLRDGRPRGRAGPDRARRRAGRATASRSTVEPAAACSAPTRSSPSCTGRSARTGPSRACSSASTSPTSGPGVLAAAVTMDKLIFKRLYAFHGLPQVAFCEVGEEGWREHRRRHARARCGSSRRGSARASGSPRSRTRRASSTRPSTAARQHDPRVIVEADAGGHRGRVLGDGQRRAGGLRPGRDHRSSADWYDYEAKYSAGRDGARRARARSATRRPRAPDRARQARLPGRRRLGPRPLRLLRAPTDGEVLVNEINTIPGFTATSVFAQALRGVGDRLPRGLRPPGPARARAARGRAQLRVLSRSARPRRSRPRSRPRCRPGP